LELTNGKICENKRKPQREGKKIIVGRVKVMPLGHDATVKQKSILPVVTFFIIF
jgi:hypothetical protein